MRIGSPVLAIKAYNGFTGVIRVLVSSTTHLSLAIYHTFGSLPTLPRFTTQEYSFY